MWGGGVHDAICDPSPTLPRPTEGDGPIVEQVIALILAHVEAQVRPPATAT